MYATNQDLSGSSNGKESAANVGDPNSIPPSEDALEKRMAAHSSIPAWTHEREPCRLQAMGFQESDMHDPRQSLNCYLQTLIIKDGRKGWMHISQCDFNIFHRNTPSFLFSFLTSKLHLKLSS